MRTRVLAGTRRGGPWVEDFVQRTVLAEENDEVAQALVNREVRHRFQFADLVVELDFAARVDRLAAFIEVIPLFFQRSIAYARQPVAVR